MRVVLVAVLLAACGHNELSPESYPAALAKAVCVPQAACRRQAVWVEQDCETEVQGSFMPDLGKALAAGRVRFDAASAQACVDGLTGRGCERESADVTIACANALTGTVTQGTSCSWLYECAGTYCEPQKSGACPGTCSAAVPEGGACGDSGQCDRSKGLRCIASVCSALHVAGEGCASTSDCRPDFFCDSASSRCAPRVNEQAVCADDSECVSGLYCRLTTAGGLCEKLAAAGAPCGQDQDHATSVASQCAPPLLCTGFKQQKGGPLAGNCTTAGQIGASCDVTADITGCAEGLICSAGRCAIAPATGPCSSDEDCEPASHYCDASMTCQPAKDDGQSCTRKEECKSRYCDGASGQCATQPDLACHEP